MRRRSSPLFLLCVTGTALLAFSVVLRGEERRLELSIVGTRIETDQFGLPSALEGVVFFRGGPAHGMMAGSYRERLTPRLDPELGLTGSSGEAVFRLIRREAGAVKAEEVVTHHRSMVVGEVPSRGALLVESRGRIVAGRKGFERPVGRMVSSSTVRLGESFELDVHLTLTFDDAPGSAGQSAAPEGSGVTPSATSLTITIGEDGAARLRYSSEFKRGLLRRLAGPHGVSPAELSRATGLSEALLARWSAESRQLAAVSSMMKKLLPAPSARRRSFEEKLRIVLRTAAYSEAELDDFLSRERLSRDDLAGWRQAIEAAAVAPATAEPDAAQAIKALERGVEALFERDGEGDPDGG